MAQAGIDVSFDITNILREPYGPPPVFNPVLGPIHAGGNVDVRVFDSLQGVDLATSPGSASASSTCLGLSARRCRAAASTAFTSIPTCRFRRGWR
jgi:hypothetical protein